jgi:hypothetical protein
VSSGSESCRIVNLLTHTIAPDSSRVASCRVTGLRILRLIQTARVDAHSVSAEYVSHVFELGVDAR